MGQIKQKFLEMEEKLSGSEPSPADDIVTDSEGNEYSGALEILCQSDRITYSKGRTHERDIRFK